MDLCKRLGRYWVVMGTVAIGMGAVSPASGADAITVAAANAPVVGNVAFAMGDVFVDKTRAKNGTPLKLGSLVTTDVGKATLLLGKSTVMHLDSESQVKITQYVVEHGKEESAQLDLRYGKTRALIFNKGVTKKNFQIRTKSAVMGVRGTHVYVDAPRDVSEPPSFMTVEGEAKVAFNAPPPAAGDPEKSGNKPGAKSEVILHANDLVKGGASGGGSSEAPQVVRLLPGAVQELANNVAPPPPDIRTRGEARDFGVNGPPPPPMGPPMPGLLPPPPPPPGYDPLGDGLTPVIIQVRGTKQ